MLLIPQGSPLLKFQYFKFEAGILDPGLNTVFEKKSKPIPSDYRESSVNADSLCSNTC